MNLTYVHDSDWAEFEKKYPHAQHFLQTRALANECNALRNERDEIESWQTPLDGFHSARLTWLKERIKQLTLDAWEIERTP